MPTNEPGRILIVDDEMIVRDMLQNYLSRLKYETLTAINGVDCIEKFADFKPHLILLDLRMPQMDGLEVLRKLALDEQSQFSIIVLTGHGDEEEAETCYDLGVRLFLHKPINMIELHGAIKRYLETLNYANALREMNKTLELKVVERTKSLLDEIAQHTITSQHDRLLSKIIQFSPSMVVLTNAQGEIEYVNPKFVEVSGYSFEEVQGKNPRVLNSGHQPKEVYTQLWNTILKGESWHGVLQNKRKDNQLYWVKQSIASIKNVEGKITNFIAIGEDVSPQIEAQESLKQSNLQLQITYQELERISHTFRLFVPTQFINRMAYNGIDFLQPGYVEEEKLTILFSDIRDYTAISEYMTPLATFQYLNEYLSHMEPCVTKHNGFIDKFIGDGIMALFDNEHSATSAVLAAIDMQNELKCFNQARHLRNLPSTHVGIGINTGNVIFGTLGSEKRLNSTVVGDHVNLAARLEELTKKFRSKILISEYTFAELPENFCAHRLVDMVRVRGKSIPVKIYEIFATDDTELREKKMATQEFLQKGIHFYQNNFLSDALHLFNICNTIWESDVVVNEYISRCQRFLKNPAILPWDGITNF